MLRSLTCFSLIFCASLATASAKAPTHKAMVGPSASAQPGCLSDSRLVSHIAYTVTAADAGGTPKLQSCSQLLSTDTLVTVRRWGRT